MTLDAPHSGSLRRGSCPGVYTPMASGDGLLLRVRCAARTLHGDHLRVLAELSARYGNGQLELTRRANIQLRGVHDVAALQAGLVTAGLSEASPTRERRLAPLLVDPLASIDVRPFEDALAECEYEPSAKLAIVLEGDSGVLADVAADIRVRVDAAHAHLSLAGLGLLGTCALAQAPAVVCMLAQLARGGRIRELAFDPTQLRVQLALAAPRPLMTQKRGLLGDQGSFFGVALPFGAGDAATFERLARLAGEGVRVAPSRVLLFAGRRDPRDFAGLITSADDPLRRLIACPGAPLCSAAHGDARTIARSLAELGERVHVSGCEKGCAHSGTSAITLVCAPGGVRLARAADVATAVRAPTISLPEARRQLAASADAVRLRPQMTRKYEYVREGAEIYRRSFAIIRAEAKLARFGAIEERVAVRLVHTSGMVDLADDLAFTPDFADAASRALRAGAPVLCDAKMIVSGVTRARLSADNPLLCFLDQPGLAALAREQRTTRSAAALEYWKPLLNGALVAIGNAPTALFRLLELFDELDARPAAVIGLPVGFVGAAESKDALLADGRVPAMIVRGRRGGSALAVAAINALASDEE